MPCQSPRTVAAAILLLPCLIGRGPAVEAIRITPQNYARVVPAGKEIDAIYGDWVLRNERLVAVIAQPIADRKANMTVRGVGGCLIDLTRRNYGSDQLSCLYPAGSRYLFEIPNSLVISRADGTPVEPGNDSPIKDKSLRITIRGKSIAGDDSTAIATFALSDGQDWLDFSATIRNSGQEPIQAVAEVALRCDGNLFKTDSEDALRIFYAEDQYFRQCYGLMFDSGNVVRAGDRNMLLHPTAEAKATLQPTQDFAWQGKIGCSQGLPGIRSWARGLAESKATLPMQLRLQSPHGTVEHASVEFMLGDVSLGSVQSDEEGYARTELLPGAYLAIVNSIGREPREHRFEVESHPVAETITLPSASRVRAKIVDEAGKAIAAKVQFVGIGDTLSPDFGPTSAIDAVKNVVYCANGKFEQPIAPGQYKLIVSHGPEYDAQILDMRIEPGQLHDLATQLTRTVDTRGWVSADFHSHSSPSGDNVSHQTGRVLNLLAEHIEFAPCTEHNRIDTYDDDLQLLGATSAMATCTGMELTGSPLPINHQNAFPLHRHEHEQDGGGPQTDSDPVKQIERLALWDSSSSKVVQSNHPYIPQILGDKDLDEKPDEGFRGMLDWMDVIEVHPPQGIFEVPNANAATKEKYRNPIFYWMQLLNLGYRIPGVVNTDAHYNFHGSGWMRNYLRSSSDAPQEIKIEEMIHSAEHGHLVMTTGPFLQAAVFLPGSADGRLHGAGEDIVVGNAATQLHVRVQCANWLDVNRVQIFANGRPLENLNFTRKLHPEMFTSQVVRFEQLIELPKFEIDTHIIVATIGEGLQLGPVMGEEFGKLPPVAVSNPIFLDIDGSGFQGNGDDLGIPFMVPAIDP